VGGLVTGFQGIAATPDDQFVAYVSGVDMEDAYQDNQTSPDIYLRWAGGTQLISRAFGSAVGGREPSISADGRYIAFSSQSRALTPDLDDLNNGRDVFIYDRFNDTFARVSIPPLDGKGPPKALLTHTSLPMGNGLSFQPIHW